MSHQIAIVIRHFAEKQVLKLTPNYLIFYLEIIGSRSLNGGGGGGVPPRILDRGGPRRFVDPNPI